MTVDHPLINKYDIPTVWVVVLVDFFGKFPWPGFAAFCAAVYTILRTVHFCIKWYRGRR